MILALGMQPAPSADAHLSVLRIFNGVLGRGRGPRRGIPAGEPGAMLPWAPHRGLAGRIRAEAPVAAQPHEHGDGQIAQRFDELFRIVPGVKHEQWWGRAGRPRFDADQATRRRVTERFLSASTSGDLDALMGVLAPGVTLVTDGGGVVRAALRPIVGADKVARFLVAVPKQLPADLRAQVVALNGGPGVVFTSAGTPIGGLLLDVADGRVQTLYLVANPEKLAGLRDLQAS
jgi:hypothetical protein